MVEVDYRSFLLGAVLGLPVCIALWYFTRSWAAHNWLVRAVIALSFATVLSPSLPFSPHGSRSLVMPAVYFLQYATDGVDGLLTMLLFGVLPIFTISLIFFSLSRLWTRRRNANGAA
jgi:hypothetical protein